MPKTKKKAGPKSEKPPPKGHWIVTTLAANSLRIISDTKLLTLLKHKRGCIVTWKKGPPLRDHA